MAEPLPSCSAVDMAVESTPPIKKRLLSPTGSTSCPPTRSNSSLEDSETSSVPKVGWPNLLPGGFDAGSDLDLDKHLSPAVYSRSSTQTSLKSPPPPPPNPSIKRRLRLSLSPKHCADDPSSRPATKPKPATAVPTAAKSSTPGPPPLVATRLKLAPPPPRPEGATPEPTPPAKAITPVLHKPAQPTPAAMPKPAQPTPPPAKAIAPVLPKPPQPTPPPQPEDHLSPATLEKHSPPAPAPESAPEEHRSPAGQSEQHPPKEKRVSWAEPSVPPEAAHEPPAEVRSQAVAPAAEATPATPPSSAEAAEPKASAHCAKVPSQAVPEAPAATPAESDAKQGATNTAQAEQSPHAGTSDTAETQTPPHNGKMEHQKHEKHSPTKKEPTSSPDVNVKKTPASVLKAPPTVPATLKAQPSRPPKAASKAAPAVTGQASASKAAPAVTGQASKAAPAVPGQAAASKAAPAETGQALAPSSSLPQPLARPAALDVAHVSVDAQAATPIVPGSYNERQALQGEFKRRIKEPEANAIPQEIVDLWTDLVKNNRKAGKTALFEKWLHAGKDWSLLIIENSKSHTDRTVGRKKMGWRTRAQIIALHGGDTHAADEIIAEKTSEGLVDHHPDSHQLKTYYVCTELGRKEEEETESKITMKTQAKMNCGGEAAQKLMGGLTGDQVDGFFKLRTFQKPSQASQEVAQGSPTTVLPQPNKKPGTRRAAPKEMPADPIEGLQWIVPKLLKDLTEAKMWPIKMVQVKHQETLRDTLLAQSKGLETTFFEMKHYLDQYKEENGFDPSEDEEFLEKLTNAVAIRDAYAETAGMASKLCKPKGGRRSANKAADEE